MKKKYRCLFDTFIVNVVLLFSSIIYIKNYVDKMSSDFYIIFIEVPITNVVSILIIYL